MTDGVSYGSSPEGTSSPILEGNQVEIVFGTESEFFTR